MYHGAPMLRFLLVAGAIFLVLNIVAIALLLRLHPRRRPFTIAIAAIAI
jgi:hypothetical protein